MKHFNNHICHIILSVCLLFAGCTESDVPVAFKQIEKQPDIYPEYKDITIPSNIAPLHFKIEEQGDGFITRLTYPRGKWIVTGSKVCPSQKEWQAILKAAQGNRITVEVYASRNGQWERFRPFTYTVAEEPIDPYLSYRIIAPSYIAYEELTINQRNLTNFEEKEIYNNMLLSTEKDGQCINCHSYQNYSTDNMQFHARQNFGGTMLVVDGNMKKVDLKTDSTISAGVYPAWHPTRKLIAYSTNNTGQSFHTKHSNKVEVQDSHSDLILYDIDANTVSKIEADPNELETFPCWAPDGKTLYYVSAHFELVDSLEADPQTIKNYRNILYDIYRKPFDSETQTFGPKERIFSASGLHRSATLPRVSPDGRYLLFTMGDYGCFHIWHKSSDLFLMDLQNDSLEVRKLENINSPDVESYHSWSSNGRWIVFSSRREDGNYTRPFIAYFDKQGFAHKPFALPQNNPEFHREFCKSYNIPEFMKEPVHITPQAFAKGLQKPAMKAVYKTNKQK